MIMRVEYNEIIEMIDKMLDESIYWDSEESSAASALEDLKERLRGKFVEGLKYDTR